MFSNHNFVIYIINIYSTVIWPLIKNCYQTYPVAIFAVAGVGGGEVKAVSKILGGGRMAPG